MAKEVSVIEVNCKWYDNLCKGECKNILLKQEKKIFGFIPTGKFENSICKEVMAVKCLYKEAVKAEKKTSKKKKV